MILLYTQTDYLFYKPLRYGCFSLAAVSIVLELLWQITESALFCSEFWNLLCTFGIICVFSTFCVLLLVFNKNYIAVNENNVRRGKDYIEENMMLVTMLILVVMCLSLFAMIITRIFAYQLIKFALIFIS